MKKVVLVLLMLVTLMWLPLKASTPPSLHAVVNGKKSPLTLSKLKVDVKVSGLIAETKMTMTFYNPTNWVVEGQLTFPLPEGAFVSGYGLDINGQMVDGVVVEKERGRVVFETIVKRGTDPGLVEWSEGNSFKTRVYPIRRRNSRTIMVRYLSEIKKQNNKSLLHIPLNYNLKVDEFSLKVQLLAPSPTSENDTKDPADFQMGQWKSARVTESSRKNFLLDKDINIPVPLENIKEAYVEQNPDGQYYFSIHPVKPGMADPVKPGVADPVKPGVAGPVKPVHPVHPGTAKGVKNKAPKHITILWDASGSMGKLDHKKEIILLKKYLSQYKTQSIRVSLKEFRFSETKTRHFKVNCGNAGKLLKAIKGIQYDGATSLNTITPSAKEKQPDFYLLFTDGNHNFGKWKKESLRFKRQVYVIIPAAGSNHKFLKSLAFETGGNALDLGKKENRQISDIMGPSAYRFISATAGNNSVTELFPNYSQPADKPLTVTGILLKKKAIVTLNYGINGKILKKVPYKLSRQRATKSSIIRTFWAQEKIRALMKTPDSKKELIDTGKKYGMVTPGTSLIVLESLRQYLEFRIKPPESLPRMRADYEARIAGKKKRQINKFEEIVKLWQKRVQWWNKDFQAPKSKTKKKKEMAVLREPVRESMPETTQKPTARPAQTESKPETTAAESRKTAAKPPVTVSSERSAEATRSGLGNIFGNIVLADGNVFPGVLVELTGGANKTSVSNEQGIFIFRNLKPNTYQVRCELEGFKTVIQKNIHVASGRNSHLNVMMETASIQQEVVITGQATVIDTRKTTVGVNVSREAVETIAEDNLYQIDGISSTDPSAGTRPKGVNFDSVSDSIGGGTKAGSRPHKTKASEIVIKPWDPETPYMKSLTKAGPKEAFDSYMKLKAIYGKSPGFYLDCSDYFCKQNQLETGLQVLSNIAEMELGSAFFLRVYGHRLARLGYLKRSVEVFREVVEIRPDEPQSYRDLALVSAQLGRYKEAVELLYKVVTRDWSKGKRYSDIEIISLMEMNRIIAKAGKNFDANIDARLIKLLDVDIRIVLSWDSGATDIDLYIKDPNGEQSDFQNTLTRIGGLHSKDNTNGYGPEEFVLKNAVPGKYIIEGDYFGTNDDKLPGPVTLNLDFYTNYGRKNEEKKSITLRLSTVDETIVIGEIIF